MHPDEIGESMKLLKQHIYKDRMKKELQKPATFIMKQIIEAKTCAESSKKDVYKRQTYTCYRDAFSHYQSALAHQDELTYPPDLHQHAANKPSFSYSPAASSLFWMCLQPIL